MHQTKYFRLFSTASKTISGYLQPRKYVLDEFVTFIPEALIIYACALCIKSIVKLVLLWNKTLTEGTLRSDWMQFDIKKQQWQNCNTSIVMGCGVLVKGFGLETELESRLQRENALDRWIMTSVCQCPPSNSCQITVMCSHYMSRTFYATSVFLLFFSLGKNAISVAFQSDEVYRTV